MSEKKNIFPTWGVNFLPPKEEQTHEAIGIEQGLDFMLAHFQEPLWPRNVSTAATRNGQRPVYDRDRAILFYQGALRQDCRLACYPNYEELAKSDPKTPAPKPKPKPSHLFIDLDLDTFAGDRHKLDLALKMTLRNIKRQLNDDGDRGRPTVLWSGGGYHVHQPLDAIAIPAYEELPEFKRYKDPSIQFMRYAERQLTGGKGDRNHCVSFRSCMARIPGSINSKHTGEATEVRIVQRWDGVRARPTTQFMLTDFLIWLVQADFDAREKLRKTTNYFSGRSASVRQMSNGGSSNNIGWIEKLLQTPIPDWRKTAVALILAPYLITIKRLSYEQAYMTIMQWATQCGKLSSLRPTTRGFIDRVHVSLDRAQQKGQRPMKWITLVKDYSAMHETFKLNFS